MPPGLSGALVEGPAPDDATKPAVGTTLAGRYELVAPLEDAPCPMVWRAVDTLLGRAVLVHITGRRTPGALDDAARLFRRTALDGGWLDGVLFVVVATEVDEAGSYFGLDPEPAPAAVLVAPQPLALPSSPATPKWLVGGQAPEWLAGPATTDDRAPSLAGLTAPAHEHDGVSGSMVTRSRYGSTRTKVLVSVLGSALALTVAAGAVVAASVPPPVRTPVPGLPVGEAPTTSIPAGPSAEPTTSTAPTSTSTVGRVTTTTRSTTTRKPSGPTTTR